MKKIAILSALLVLLASSCEIRPEADFYVTSPVVDVYENVYFSNTSSHVDYYKWNFGDGNVSSLPNPSHYYELPGSYTVTLEAYQGSKEIDQASMIIDVLSTSLEIEVLEYIDRYPVPEASIVLYTTQYDWDNFTNPVFDGEWFTDANGFVMIHGLNPIVYYVDIWHPTHDNWTLAEEDIENVKTLPLERHKINSYTFYVDYVERASASRKDSRQVSQYKIVKIERKTPGNQAR
jgi:hypothetical protein